MYCEFGGHQPDHGREQRRLGELVAHRCSFPLWQPRQSVQTRERRFGPHGPASGRNLPAQFQHRKTTGLQESTGAGVPSSYRIDIQITAGSGSVRSGCYTDTTTGIAVSSCKDTSAELAQEHLTAEPWGSNMVASAAAHDSFNLLWGASDKFNGLNLSCSDSGTIGRSESLTSTYIYNTISGAIWGSSEALVTITTALPFDTVTFTSSESAIDFDPKFFLPKP